MVEEIKTDFRHIPIHNAPLPPEYNEVPHIVRSRNHPNWDEMEDFDPFRSDLDSTMSQITNINTQLSSDDEDSIFDVVSETMALSDQIITKIPKVFMQSYNQTSRKL